MTRTNQTFRIAGGRVGVLLLHSLGGTPAEFRYVASGLGRAGYSVLCPQLAGHCGTAGALAESRWQQWLASAEAALVELAATCDVVVAGGQSTGAILALMLAARRPDLVTATALLSPTLSCNGWAIPWYASAFRLVCSRTFAALFNLRIGKGPNVKDPRVQAFLRDARAKGDRAGAVMGSLPGPAVVEHRRLVASRDRALSGIRQPALILHAREDDVAHLDNAWRLQARLAGPVETTVLDDCFHMISLDRQRHVVVDRLLHFVGRAATPHARKLVPTREDVENTPAALVA